MMQIKKAIITAAGKSQRRLPLQTMVDRDGQNKTALRIVIEEILKAGIDEIAVIIWPGDQNAFAEAAGEQLNRLSFIEQQAPLGFGNAVLTGSEFVGRHPFLLVVGDHLYVDRGGKSCARQLIEIAASQQCAVSAVQRTHESKLPLYGTVGGRLVPGQKGLYEVDAVIEKPTPTEAEQRLIVAGLRAGYYLCFFGMHVLTPAIMDVLRAQDEAGARASAGSDPRRNGHLTFALAALAARERYLATELAGRRYDIGAKYGLLIAQLALALEGEERDELLTNLVELLALRDQ